MLLGGDMLPITTFATRLRFVVGCCSLVLFSGCNDEDDTPGDGGSSGCLPTTQVGESIYQACADTIVLDVGADGYFIEPPDRSSRTSTPRASSSIAWHASSTAAIRSGVATRSLAKTAVRKATRADALPPVTLVSDSRSTSRRATTPSSRASVSRSTSETRRSARANPRSGRPSPRSRSAA